MREHESVSHSHHAKRHDLLTVQPFQLGYVTTDIEEAIARYSREFDASNFLISERQIQAFSARAELSLRVRLAMGFVGESMVEFIQPLGGDVDIYTRLLPDRGFGIALHHFGYVVDPAADWPVFRGGIDDDEILCESEGDPSFLYLDTYASLGHYLEYLHFSRQSYESWIQRVPRNG